MDNLTLPSKDISFRPGEIWPDDRGRHIQAHGGGVIKLGNVWYWFGEDRSKDNAPDFRFAACYSSEDLANWKFRRQVLKLSDPANLGSKWVLERPKVYYNSKSGKYVMYMHIDGRVPGSDSDYGFASVGVATCDTVDGEYEFIRHFRPLGKESRDIGQFIDDDGTAYLIFESRPSKGFYIAELSKDYLDVEREVAFIKAPLEGGAIVNYEGLYYMTGSLLTGWKANPNKYASAKRLEGPWSDFKDFAPPETNTYSSQSSNIIKVTGSRNTTVIYVGDRWLPERQWESSYVWMPLEIGGGNLRLPEPGEWSLNVKTGEARIRQCQTINA